MDPIVDTTPHNVIAYWADLAWLPIAVIVAAPRHRIYLCGFVGACVFTLRAQVEMMATTSHPRGFLPQIFDGDPLLRGQVVYGIITAIFFALAFASRKAPDVVVLAASITIYILAFCISMVILAI